MTAAEIQLNVVAQSLRAMSEVIDTLAKTLPDRQANERPATKVTEQAHLTTSEAAKMIKCSPNTLAIWRMRGTGPKYICIGSGQRKTIRYRREDIDRYCEENTR
jgi:hypothetical protein